MTPNDSYQDALDYIYQFTDYERRGFATYAPENYDLRRVEHLLDLLGKPQDSFQSVHIAGTKGKGSTAAMIESVLRAQGFRTGLYTSPHLHTFRERIQVDGEMIPETEVARLVTKMRPLVAQVEEITTFEVMTGLAFAWYAEQSVEWAVLEVGMGGRLDATNVVEPAVAVITPISYDHVATLGSTLTKIATEKAGIIKPGIPVVCAPQPEEALTVIEATCKEHDTQLVLVGRDWTWVPAGSDLDGQAFDVHHGSESATGLWIPLLGKHQLSNATTALATLAQLRAIDVPISDSAIREGLRAVYWPARMEILGYAPLVIADGAHNVDSAEKLRAALEKSFDYEELILIMGASPDHATADMLNALLYGVQRAIVTQSHHPRSATPRQLQAHAEHLGFQPEVCQSVPEALNLALAEAGPQDLICCTGSLFVAAEAREAWFARQGLASPPSDPS
jgi:dihydrofolate synthase/folylpolyglutamate synthase